MRGSATMTAATAMATRTEQIIFDNHTARLHHAPAPVIYSHRTFAHQYHAHQVYFLHDSPTVVIIIIAVVSPPSDSGSLPPADER